MGGAELSAASKLIKKQSALSARARDDFSNFIDVEVVR
jgi:hypothetical protein